MSTVDIEVDGALTWEYLRQTTYSLEPAASGNTKSFIVNDAPPRSLADSLLGMSRVDVNGEIWIVTAVDEALLDPELVASRELRIARWTPDADLVPGEVVSWVPESWSYLDCDSDGLMDVNLWDVESRVLKVAPYGHRQTAAVAVTNPDVCSAVMLKDNFALTAAHCVEDISGNPYVPATIILRSVHNDVATGVFATRSAAWVAGSQNYADDWAVIELAAPFTTAVTTSDIYSGPEADYEGPEAGVNMLGFPRDLEASTGGCLSNAAANLYHSAVPEVTSTTSNGAIRLKSDSSRGQSGAVYGFCPNGTWTGCNGPPLTDPMEVIGVHSGHVNNILFERSVGPAAVHFRPEVETIVN